MILQQSDGYECRRFRNLTDIAQTRVRRSPSDHIIKSSPRLINALFILIDSKLHSCGKGRILQKGKGELLCMNSGIFLSTSRFFPVLSILLFSFLAIQAAPSSLNEGNNSIVLTAGTGMPSVLNGSAIFCPAGNNFYLQGSGSTFFWFGWEGGASGGYVLRNFGKGFGLSNATGFAGIGFRHIYSTRFFLGKETDATAKFEINNCIDLSFSYIKFWSNGLGWTTGLDVPISLTHSGFIPELHIGLVVSAM